MNYLLNTLLVLFLISPGSLGEDRAMPVSIIELVASPEKFDKVVVDITAFLTIEHPQRHGPQAMLWLHQEDARNLLPNGVGIILSKQMLQDEEKINNVYVVLRGTFHATRSAGGGFALQVGDVQNCVPWSNPDRPLGVKPAGPGQKPR